MSNGAGGYTPILQINDEIGKAWDAGATVAALAMVYVGIDTMTFLSCPLVTGQTRIDFIGWVDRYLQGDPYSQYQYNGRDVYAARCAVLHSYGSTANIHRNNNPPRVFGYTDNGPHMIDEQDNFVIISVAVLIQDYTKAVNRFIGEMRNDPDLKARVDNRVGSLLLTQRRNST